MQVSLNYKHVDISKEILEYTKPNLVYIPLTNHTEMDCKCIVSVGDYVYKDTVVGEREKGFYLPIYSSVSGTVVSIETITHNTNKQVKCVVIENDFKEAYKEEIYIKDKINEYTKEEFINIIKDCAVVGMGGSEFPTYIKYKTDKEINTLLINAVECEPYISSDLAITHKYSEEILECCDAIMEINKIKRCVIGVKDTNTTLINNLNNYIGSYPNISLCLVKNYYPAGWEKNLVKDALMLSYEALPIEKGIVVNNISTIYAIYVALKLNKSLSERIVTFVSEYFEKPVNVSVKIGTKASEVIESLINYKDTKERLVLISGGPMMGISLKTDDIAITKSMNAILVKKVIDDTPISCLNCGKCVDVCPAKLSPVLINKNIHDIEYIKKINALKCIECGLCSYICPSKILVREGVKNAKNKIRESL